MSGLIEKASALRTTLLDPIRQHHLLAQSAARDALAHAFSCGELLLQAKKQAGHGLWLDFLNEVGISSRQAQRYMQVARHRGKFEKNDTTSHFTLKGALQEIATPRKPPVIVAMEAGHGIVFSKEDPVAAIRNGDLLAWIEPAGREEDRRYWHYGFLFGSVAVFSRRGSGPNAPGAWRKFQMMMEVNNLLIPDISDIIENPELSPFCGKMLFGSSFEDSPEQTTTPCPTKGS